MERRSMMLLASGYSFCNGNLSRKCNERYKQDMVVNYITDFLGTL